MGKMPTGGPSAGDIRDGAVAARGDDHVHSRLQPGCQARGQLSAAAFNEVHPAARKMLFHQAA